MIFILNGPNLNLLSVRQPDIYGHETLESIQKNCEKIAKQFGHDLDFRQTNHEGVLVDWVQEVGVRGKGLIINGGGLTHTSVSLLDALLMLSVPVIEVHLSLTAKRETFRHHSFITPAAKGVIAGFGASGYTLALRALIEMINIQE
ncbi:MAG: type II 3-dehydroquinate dehydratase [Alphaproteobacteria bacterium]|nr:type II 3-dehydroquinate dehydratase [Alphaproteobacteria bacterium]